MTVSTSTATAQYTGNGATLVFPYTWPIFADSEILVQTKVVATGVITTRILGTDYSVSGSGVNSTGGNITFVVAPATGVRIVISRNSPYTQQIHYTEYDTFPAVTHETGLDRGVMLAQQLRDQVVSSVRLDPTLSNINPIITVANPNQFLRINSTGTQIESAVITAAGSLALPVSPGVVTYNGTMSLISNVITGSSLITVANGDGVSGAPTIDFAANALLLTKTLTARSSNFKISNTADTFPTSFTVTNTAARTINFPDASGTVQVTGTAVNVADGGTGRTTQTAFTLLAGGTTTTGPQQSVTAGTSGQILTSAGAAAIPTWSSTSAFGSSIADMKAATTNTTFVTPLVQWLHPGHAKVVCNFTAVSTTPVTLAGTYNVSSLTDNNVGDTTINFSITMSSINYAFVGAAMNTAAVIVVSGSNAVAPTATSLRVVTANTSAAAVDARAAIVIFGDV